MRINVYIKSKENKISETLSNFPKKIFLLLASFIFSVFIGILLLSSYQPAGAQNTYFNITYAEESLSKEDIPMIVPSHPRLFIRLSPWKHGPDLTTLRRRAKKEPLKSYLKRKAWAPKPGLEWAFRYLITGDEKLVPPLIERMKHKMGYWPGRLARLAILYDWLYNSPNFSDRDKRIVEDKMIVFAKKAIKAGERYSDMWSHFGYRPPLDVAAAGLALYGHREEAKKFVAMAGGYVKRNMLPAWALNDGAWQGGWAYYGQGCYNLFKFIAMWSSATNEDLYELIAQEQGNWVLNHLYYLIYTIYPDRTPADTSGFNWAGQDGNDLGATKSLLLLSSAYGDSQGALNLKWRNPWGYRLGIDQFLYYLPKVGNSQKGYSTLPLTRCWGRKGIGYVQLRSGWGKDDTIVEFKCGDYFWSHQFQNQNSFTIYHKGRLAIQSGAYAGHYFGSHVLHYYRPTVSSNTLLIIQPGERSWIPPEVARRRGIKAKDGYFPEYGGQRSCYIIPKYGSAETCFTYEKYLYRKNHQHHFETGDIKAFEVTDRYSYVCGDATMAYNNPDVSYPGNEPKIDLFTRQLVFLDKKYLVIFDRVNSLNPEYEKRWLLHSIGEPKFGDKPVRVEYPFHREIYKGGLVRIDNKGGTLFCQTLFPDDYYIRKVGGSATVTKAKPDQANRGSGSLSTTIHRKYKRMGATIASDRARREDWIIQFMDSDHFKIKGSVTGEDGIGSYSNPKGGVFISKSQSIFIPKENWKGTPKKGDKFYFSVTSPSHRFWVNGTNFYPPPKSLMKILKMGSHIDPGNWRIEVFPKKLKRFDIFMHLLYPTDRSAVVPPASEGVISSDNVMRGVSIDNWLVFFGHRHTVEKETEYPVKNTMETVNLLLDMKPEKNYLISISKRSSESKKLRLTASKEGTLFFTATGPCLVKVAPL
jgi:hypothetical protein